VSLYRNLCNADYILWLQLCGKQNCDRKKKHKMDRFPSQWQLRKTIFIIKFFEIDKINNPNSCRIYCHVSAHCASREASFDMFTKYFDSSVHRIVHADRTQAAQSARWPGHGLFKCVWWDASGFGSLLLSSQWRAKLNPIVKTVKNSWISDANTPSCSENRAVKF
jgi:hypothetical protein